MMHDEGVNEPTRSVIELNESRTNSFVRFQFELDKMSDEVDSLNKKLEEERALRETVSIKCRHG